jgi:hypothetical protein
MKDQTASHEILTGHLPPVTQPHVEGIEAKEATFRAGFSEMLETATSSRGD